MQKVIMNNDFPLFYCLLLCSNLTLAVPLYSVGLPPKINFGFGLNILHLFFLPQYQATTQGRHYSPARKNPSSLRRKALRRLSSRFNGIGGLPRGDKGRIETSLVPPWRVIEKKLSHLINLLTPTQITIQFASLNQAINYNLK